jgi:hypothetical protein
VTWISGGRGERAATGLALALLASLVLSCGGDPASPANPHAPTLSVGGSLSAAEETTRVIAVTATDADGDTLTLSASGLPGFASFADLGGGAGELTLAPRLGEAGSYPGVVLKAGDGELADSLVVTLAVTPMARIEDALLYEPITFCLAGDDQPDTLFIYNRSDYALHWRPIHVPEGAQGLDTPREVAPHSVETVPWTWTPTAPLPLVDTLVALTNDQDHARVEIPFRAVAAGAIDMVAPPAPWLFAPEDGAVFTLVRKEGTDSLFADIDVAWSEIDDCSGVQYWLEISRTPVFPSKPIRFITRATAVTVVAEQVLGTAVDDRGIAYWRVFAKDDAGLVGPYGEVRTWTVVGP